MDRQADFLGDIWRLLLASAALMGSPGPSTLSVTAVGATFGLRRSLAYVLGLILGTTAVMLFIATGISAVLLSLPQLAPALTVASAAYIVFLAVRIARAPPLPQQDPAAAVPSMIGGLMLAVANPKAYVTIAAVFAGSRLDGFSPSAQMAIKMTVLTGMIVLIHLGWLLAGTSLSRVLRHPLASRAVNFVLAGVLVITSLAAIWP